MTWSVDVPIRVGSVAFAAIVETDISVHFRSRGLVGVAHKRPLLLLRAHEGNVDAFDSTGRGVDAETVEKLYPNAISQLRQMLQKKGGV